MLWIEFRQLGMLIQSRNKASSFWCVCSRTHPNAHKRTHNHTVLQKNKNASPANEFAVACLISSGTIGEHLVKESASITIEIFPHYALMSSPEWPFEEVFSFHISNACGLPIKEGSSDYSVTISLDHHLLHSGNPIALTKVELTRRTKNQCQRKAWA